MKSTGIVRRIDSLGRIVLPKELRRIFNMNNNDPVEIYTDGDKIILKKFERSCVFCGNGEDIAEFKGKAVCARCRKELEVQE